MPEPARVALETTLLIHGVPRGEGLPLARRLEAVVRAAGAVPAVAGVFAGRGVCGLSEAELTEMLAAAEGAGVIKVNAANLGLALHRGLHAATTVSATMELAAAAGVRVFATGGLGGVHRAAPPLDVSSDLFAMTRYPVAVVCSGVKSILDVAGTREVLEALGVPVVGFGTDLFPAFYQRSIDAAVRVDARFDEVEALARFVSGELRRAGRAVVVCNPVPAEHEIEADAWAGWLAEAERRAAAARVTGRDVTPFVLGALHEISGGRTLRTNVELVVSNADLAGRLAAAMGA